MQLQEKVRLTALRQLVQPASFQSQDLLKRVTGDPWRGLDIVPFLTPHLLAELALWITSIHFAAEFQQGLRRQLTPMQTCQTCCQTCCYRSCNQQEHWC